ncbi:hypothetical protein [Sphingomonas sp. CFBP9021]|uniref:hypothetical protein n=1 Tax=Sphingomonas sp. CFBP9021 TaxID=3096534 RepID=UPI002A6A2B95|nr:hypothetical protein [Sphingomonas sp. CFBP9021]MDY0969052.1 hypothetical protein [Sphingomonas sp. CFBP9021]
MIKFYEVMRELYNAKFGDGSHQFAAKVDIDGKVAALDGAIADGERLSTRLSHAIKAARAAGADTSKMGNEADRLSWILIQLRSLAANASDLEILATKKQLDEASDRLEKANKATADLAEDLAVATAAINALGKVLQL